MRILLLTQILPYPLDSGPKVKTYHVVRYLEEHGHRVTLVSFVRKEEEPHLDQFKSFCDAIYAVTIRRSRLEDLMAYGSSLRCGLPFLVTRDAKREMRTLVSRLVREQPFDIIHADQLTMAQYALASRQSLVQSRQSRPPEFNPPSLVFDAHNAVWTIVERFQQHAPFCLRPLLAQEARRLKSYEGRVCHEMDAVLAVSEIDRCALAEAGAAADKITVIPIALDSGNVPQMSPDDKQPNILTVSTLFYPPNADGIRWFARQVYPLVLQQQPNASLAIVGPRPPKDISQLVTRYAPLVTVPGYVPDLRPYLGRAAVIVVPVRAASGMRVRILEALARGIPVVTTTTGVEGIDAANGEHLFIADEPEQFAGAVTCLLKDVDLRRRLAENGRRLVKDKYDWRIALTKLDQVYQSIVRN